MIRRIEPVLSISNLKSNMNNSAEENSEIFSSYLDENSFSFDEIFQEELKNQEDIET